MANPVEKTLIPALDATPVYIHYGEKWEQNMSYACQWFALITSLLILMWYIKQTIGRKCGWEEFYVCLVETIKVIFDMNLAFVSPATVYQYNGIYTHWLRYSEWLLTCPVILIHLSNVTGLEGEYSKRSMSLLVSDVGTIVFGVTAALSKGFYKVIFFMIGLCYGSNTFFSAARAFIEAHHKVPKGKCRKLVKMMAYAFFGSWVWYPILFMLGPEGFGHLSVAGSDIAHTFVDMLSKNTFGFVGHFLRLEIRAYILKHGDLRKKEKMTIGGREVEVNVFAESEGEEGAEGGNDTPDSQARMLSSYDSAGDSPALDDGRVLLGVAEPSMLAYFQEEFSNLPGRIVLMTAIGSESIAHAAQQALQMGGLDYVLLPPDLLADQNLLSYLRGQLGVRICVFGWAPNAPMREAIETAPIDGILEGPSMGRGINRDQLAALTAQMQQVRKSVGMANPVFGRAVGAGNFGATQNMGAYAAPAQGNYYAGSGTATPTYQQQQQAQAEAETVQTLMKEISALKSELESA